MWSGFLWNPGVYEYVQKVEGVAVNIVERGIEHVG